MLPLIVLANVTKR